MEAYIDYNNFRSYVLSLNRKERACNDFFCGNFDLKFTFSKEACDALREEDEKFDTWVSQYMEDAGEEEDSSYEFDCHLERPLNEQDFFDPENKSRLSAIYMLDGDDVPAIAERGGVLVAKLGEELEILHNLRVTEKRFQDVEEYDIKEQKDWSVIGKFASPCTDIIIADSYVFLQGKHLNELYQKNIYEIIRQLTRFANDIPINIIFVTELTDSQIQGKTANIKQITEDIKNLVYEKVGRTPNVTFVKPWHLHDRYIITNYKWITSGPSFSYFDEHGKVYTDGDSFHIQLAASSKKRASKNRLIANVQQMIYAQRNTIAGDKKSHFLIFPERVPIPRKGDIVQLEKDENGFVNCGYAVTALKATDEELKGGYYRVTEDAMANTNKKSGPLYPYFIKVEKVDVASAAAV